jgi:hypothetical protein
VLRIAVLTRPQASQCPAFRACKVAGFPGEESGKTACRR